MMYADASRQERLLDEELASWLEWPIELAIFGIALVVYWLFSPTGGTPFFDHVKQAYAILRGHLYADGWPPHEAAQWRGHLYIVHPPLAAIVLLPFTAIGEWLRIGPGIVQTDVSIAAGALECLLVYRLVRTYGAAISASVWLTAAFAFGSMFTYEAARGTTWGLCLTLSTIPTTLALMALEEKKAIKVGLWAGIAFLARYDLSLAWIPYALSLLACNGFDLRRSIRTSGCLSDFASDMCGHCRELGQFLLGLTPSLATYAIWSWLKYGSFHDKGIELWFAQDQFHGVIRHDGFPFWIGHLPYSIYTWFFMAPSFTPHYPWIVPTDLGVSIALSTPFLFLAFRAPWRSNADRNGPFNRKTACLWLAVILSMLPASLCYASGFVQFEDRYWIMALPSLMALIAIGMSARKPSRAISHREANTQY